MLFDTHSHLYDESFAADRAEVVTRAKDAGIHTIIAVGTTAESSVSCVELANEFPGIHAAVGIQPNCVSEAVPDDWDRIVRLVGESDAVAVGETGLDRHWDYSPFDQQQDYFDRHIRLSQKVGLPFIVHMRDCDADVLQMLREARKRGPLAGVMHSFTGDTAMAAECVELGLHISFAGMITFKKSNVLLACATTVPDDRLLIETDSPYLSPEPVRKIRRNEPSHLRHTATLLAKARGVALRTLASQTTENARRFFGLSE